ncbi:unnamed protein product [Prorocentrum cordatum]|uniref:Uncharacterized protein n=1 Tax=Prorocentrum cordatum TaxID=2364126 RepID=A0ABN9W7F0_9DINO|nr:unnamed protein product [Polarella glacialis]
MLRLCERIVSDIWGDTAMYLHVEDKEVAANRLYDATGYAAIEPPQDSEFPFNDAELKAIQSTTWRRKELPAESPGCLAPAQEELETRLAEQEAEERRAQEEELLRQAEEEEEEEDSDDESSDEEGDEELQGLGEDEDFSWVASLKK